MKYAIRMTSQYKKDLKLAMKQGKDFEALFSAIERISNGESLADLRQHRLVENYNGCFEAHITPDWLLIWKVYEDEGKIYLNRLGSHSELFG